MSQLVGINLNYNRFSRVDKTRVNNFNAQG